MGGAIPGSLRRLDDADSALLLGVLRRQADAQAIYPLSYDAVRAIAGIKHLSHTNDTILDEYEEGAEDG